MLKEQVIDTIKKYNLIKENDSIVIGVSGGPDSICLLHVLYTLKQELGIEIFVAHINHMIREAADSETQYVQNFCKKLDIKCFVKKENVTYLVKQQKKGTEEIGRQIRYEFFNEILTETDSNKIATAHNSNDRAETVILNILRGSGISGLKGIEVMREQKYIRPLIDINRTDIEKYCKENGLNPRYDESNDENIYSRNKVRNIIIPYIKKEFNLKNVNVKFPLGQFICVTGVSGSGKSTLVNEILYKAISKYINHSNEKPGKHKEIVGIENIDKIINIDQSPIGRTPRSNPATYTGVFDYIRDIFSETNEAKMRGYEKGRFSFNVFGGRCEACSGDGILRIEMHFLPDIYVPCEVCKGKRYNKETLEVKYKGKTIADVLDMTVEEALEFFKNVPKIKQKIQTLYDVGLGYIKLGQPSTTLSGGEAQRVKLATELSKKPTGKTLYILDEPTTGLHIADVHKLVDILQRLVDTGNSIIVIEHNLDLIKTCDYIIDLGPEGGDNGGNIVAVGTPEQIARNNQSYTGQFLKKYLK